MSSPVEGTIVENTSECGKVAIFDGSNTIIMAHMVNRTPLRRGDRVEVGTYLGRTSGVDSGGCMVIGGPHLHMEIRTGNHPTMADPRRDNTATTRDPLAYNYGPFAPVSLLAPADRASAASSSVAFSWAPRLGAATYRIQISTTNSFDGETCLGGCLYNDAGGSTSRTFSLTAGRAYFWRVRAGNASTSQGGHWSVVRSVIR